MKLTAVSKNRYNGGVKAKRLYGSSTITEFWIFRPEDKDNPKMWVVISTGGKTPGERATTAKKRAEPLIQALLDGKSITDAYKMIR